jgi:membrane protein YqaA with SNARE-associated domain
MDRIYAGVLGSLVFAALIMRGIWHQQDPVATLKVALLGLAVFACVGWLLGSAAARTVEESVRERFQRRLLESADDE